jgi:hypothetical protein
VALRVAKARFFKKNLKEKKKEKKKEKRKKF